MRLYALDQRQDERLIRPRARYVDSEIAQPI